MSNVPPCPVCPTISRRQFPVPPRADRGRSLRRAPSAAALARVTPLRHRAADTACASSAGTRGTKRKQRKPNQFCFVGNQPTRGRTPHASQSQAGRAHTNATTVSALAIAILPVPSHAWHVSTRPRQCGQTTSHGRHARWLSTGITCHGRTDRIRHRHLAASACGMRGAYRESRQSANGNRRRARARIRPRTFSRRTRAPARGCRLSGSHNGRRDVSLCLEIYCALVVH